MRTLVQRVTEATVTVGTEVVGAIGPGLCALVGVTSTDDEATARKMAAKVWHLRIIDDAGGTMNRSLADVPEPQILVVSQFTLYGDTTRGRRPSWSAAAPPEDAEPLVAAMADELADLGATVATGRFRASMLVALVNDGPVTVLVEIDAPSRTS